VTPPDAVQTHSPDEVCAVLKCSRYEMFQATYAAREYARELALFSVNLVNPTSDTRLRLSSEKVPDLPGVFGNEGLFRGRVITNC
jgi:hypothetical protein